MILAHAGVEGALGDAGRGKISEQKIPHRVPRIPAVNRHAGQAQQRQIDVLMFAQEGTAHLQKMFAAIPGQVVVVIELHLVVS